MYQPALRESDQDVVNDPTVKGLVMDQTTQWSELMEKHRKEEWSLMKAQLQAIHFKQGFETVVTTLF